MTVQDLITRSCRMLGVSNPDAGLLADSQLVLNLLIESRNLDRNKIFTQLISTYTMAAATQTHTIGPGGEFNGPRPTKIRGINLLYQTNPIVRVWLTKMDAETYEHDIKVPNIASVPQRYYYDGGFSTTGTVGLGTIFLYPVPNIVYPLEILQDFAIADTVNLGDTLTMPPGYARSLIGDLAKEIAPEVSRPWTKDLEDLRMDANYAIEANNAPSPIMKSDPGIGSPRHGAFNYLTGEPY